MEEILDIYGRKNIYELEEARLAKAALSEANKAKIRAFCTHLFAQGASALRVAKLASQLRKLAALFGKDFEDVTREDILELLAKINRGYTTDRQLVHYYTGKIFHITGKPMTYETRKDYMRIIKRFFRWLKGKNTLLVDELKIAKKESDRNLNLGDIITDEEMLKVLQTCQTARDKALFALLHETGARAGELLTMRIKDIIHDGQLKKVRLNGKTGERRVIIITSVPYLMSYLQNHSRQEDPNTYLWLSDNPRFKGAPLHYAGFRKLVKEMFAKAGLAHKRCNPHYFRHSRATINARYLKETQMDLFFGWRIGSGQVATYVHASGRDVDDAVLEMHGIKKPEERQMPTKPQSCAICKTENEAIADFCKNCGHPLSIKAAMGVNSILKEETDKAFQLLLEIAKDPKLMAEFDKFKQNYTGVGNGK